jgi:hypothetical protein
MVLSGFVNKSYNINQRTKKHRTTEEEMEQLCLENQGTGNTPNPSWTWWWWWWWWRQWFYLNCKKLSAAETNICVEGYLAVSCAFLLHHGWMFFHPWWYKQHVGYLRHVGIIMCLILLQIWYIYICIYIYIYIWWLLLISFVERTGFFLPRWG